MLNRLKAFPDHRRQKDANVAAAVTVNTVGETLQDSVQSEVNGVNIIETNQSQGSIERVHLESFVKEPHSNPRVVLAQKKLQNSTEELEATLRKPADRSQKFPSIGDNDAKLATEAATKNLSNSGAAFGNFIERILADQEEQKGTISGKVAGYMAKLYPITNIALGLVSFGADAAGFLPLKITANGLSQVLTVYLYY